MVEPPLNERAQRQEMAGMMFETFKVFAMRTISPLHMTELAERM